MPPDGATLSQPDFCLVDPATSQPLPRRVVPLSSRSHLPAGVHQAANQRDAVGFREGRGATTPQPAAYDEVAAVRCNRILWHDYRPRSISSLLT